MKTWLDYGIYIYYNGFMKWEHGTKFYKLFLQYKKFKSQNKQENYEAQRS